jgi:Glycosyl transferase family 2
MIDLAVAYRIYPEISKSPAYFPANKFKLSEMCLQSFRAALGGLHVKIWAVLDGCPAEYESMFREILQDQDVEILNLNRIGNTATFSLQIDILTKQTEAEYVYFAEDDYFYFPGALEKMVAFMHGNLDADFVTPYDHPDCYQTSSRFERHLIRPFCDRHWRTASSTCLTFLTSRENLLRTQSIFRTYSRGNMDCSLWLSLTQKAGLGNFRVHWNSKLRTKVWAKTWQWGYRSLLFGRKYRLWSPTPTLATHMEQSCLSPLIDWQAEFDCFRQRL